MSKESAAKFVEAWEAGDSEVIKALEVQDEEVLLDPEALARVAGGIGFNATADELSELFRRRRRRILGILDSAEISDEDLEQVAGGRNVALPWPRQCSSDYDPSSRCVFDDRCLTTWHYYPAQRRCLYTFEEDETCFSDDRCSEHAHCYNPMYG